MPAARYNVMLRAFWRAHSMRWMIVEGTALHQIHHLDTFWFAWATYRPDSVLVDG